MDQLETSRFRTIYKLSYNGDAHLVLSTHVQVSLFKTDLKANPLNLPSQILSIHSHPFILFANQPLVVPMQIKIAEIRLKGVMSLVIDQDQGMTLKFKSDDPLKSVLVSSSFDNVENIKKFLQAQIERQLRSLFSEDLPQIIHKLSLSFLEEQRAKDSPSGNQRVGVARTEFSDDSTRFDDGLPEHQRSTSFMEYPLSRNVSRTHSQKWQGNDPVAGLDEEPDTPRVLTKSLSLETPINGFGRVAELADISKSQVLSRENLLRVSTRSAPASTSRDSYSPGSSTVTGLSSQTRSRRQSGFRTLKVRTSGRSPSTSISMPCLSSPVSIEPRRKSHEWPPSQPMDYETFPDPISNEPVNLEPTQNTHASRLTNLLTSNRTMSVVTHDISSVVTRADPKIRSPTLSGNSPPTEESRRRGKETMRSPLSAGLGELVDRS